jgi:hypothetical protein
MPERCVFCGDVAACTFLGRGLCVHCDDQLGLVLLSLDENWRPETPGTVATWVSRHVALLGFGEPREAVAA